MKRIIIAPDSFKGTMSSIKICRIISGVIQKHFSGVEIVKIPVADGGEGTVDCFLESVGGRKVTLRVHGPYFEEVDSFYGVLSDGETAVIEMAAAAGLPLVEGNMNPGKTTTLGVGELIRHALGNGCKRIILGLGGSCTNDGGTGMAAALGVKFLNKSGCEFIPTGETLGEIFYIDVSGRLKELGKCEILAACDVKNPLCGKNGAAYVFGPQKGADAKMVKLLDKNLLHLANVIRKDLNMDLASVAGSGAAGGMGAGVVAFAGAQLKSGIDIVLDTVMFDKIVKESDLVITGEGKLDGQSLQGKVVIGLAKRSKAYNVPVIAIVGDIGDDIDKAYLQGVTSIVSINRVAVPFEIAKTRCESDLELTADSIMRLLKLNIGR